MIPTSNYRYVEMLSKLKKHYPDIEFGEVGASLHGLMEDTKNSLEVRILLYSHTYCYTSINILVHVTYQ